ncbi:vitamin K epoxide reductase family protein [Candidatus Microgenomates bacterium]|nr:MAG: vitamin K epoxide reductase family protein [Candidatus Microgenomates bacterium]
MKNDSKLKLLLLAIVILSFLGFLDSTYLTILHYKNAFPSCSFTHGCETVQRSQYSTISILPVALLGSIYYLVLTIFSIVFLQKGNRKIFKKILILFAVVGFGASVIFFSLQAFAIKAYCEFCLLSELISTLILTFSFVLLRFKGLSKE